MKHWCLTFCIVVASLFGSVEVGFASDLPKCSSSGVFHNCFGTWTFEDGDNYVGEWKDDKLHGQGTYTFLDGRKYVGGYRDGKQHGQGTETYASGSKYIGEFRDGKQHGQGTYTFASGSKYVGEFGDGKRHGKGTYTFADGNKYVGEFKDGNYHGWGFYVFANGNADFCKYVDDEAINCSGTNTEDVASYLKETFDNLPAVKRKKVQSALKENGLYTSNSNGKWNAETFTALATYSVFNLKTVKFNNSATANELLSSVLKK